VFVKEFQTRCALERDFPGQVYEYEAVWDGKAQRVIGLEAFGREVEEALQAQVEAELAEVREPAELSWQEQEARALDDFAADRRRDFRGRTALVHEIHAFLAAPAEPGAGLCQKGHSAQKLRNLHKKGSYRPTPRRNPLSPTLTRSA
jgi:hypothetical protein